MEAAEKRTRRAAERLQNVQVWLPRAEELQGGKVIGTVLSQARALLAAVQEAFAEASRATAPPNVKRPGAKARRPGVPRRAARPGVAVLARLGRRGALVSGERAELLRGWNAISKLIEVSIPVARKLATFGERNRLPVYEGPRQGVRERQRERPVEARPGAPLRCARLRRTAAADEDPTRPSWVEPGHQRGSSVQMNHRTMTPTRPLTEEIIEATRLHTPELVKEVWDIAWRQVQHELDRQKILDDKAMSLLQAVGLSLTVAVTFGCQVLLKDPRPFAQMGAPHAAVLVAAVTVAVTCGLLAHQTLY